MAENSANYPDVLGYVTGGDRLNVNVVQAAMAVRPRVVRAGRSFEVILVVQNASDCEIDVTATLHIPDQDSNKKKGRFVAKAERLVVDMQPAEVGYIMLPISCLADTGINPEYKVGMEISVKLLGKPKRIRQSQGGGKFDLSLLDDEDIITHIEELRQLNFSAKKRGGLRSGSALETTFSVMSGRVGEIVDLQASWTSLWTLSNQLDDRMLLQRFWELLKNKALPQLNRENAFKPLMQETAKRFAAAGFPLKPVEANLIARLMTLILEYATPSQSAHGSHGHLAAGIYYIEALLDPVRLADDEPIILPHWASGMLRATVKDERVMQYPVQALVRFLYNELVYDAAMYAFGVVETVTGEKLGDDEEVKAYLDNEVIPMLAGEGEKPLDFTHVYMPLLMGGIVSFDRVLMEDERLSELIQEMRTILTERESLRSPENQFVFQLATRVVEQAMMKYGYKSDDSAG